MQKLYCYADESGQETKGNLFVVAVVVAAQNPVELFSFCQRVEQETGKNKEKWGRAQKDRRLAYLQRIFADNRFKGNLYFSVFRDTTGYDVATIMAIAKVVHAVKQSGRFTTLVYVDGLKKTKRLHYGSELRKLGISTRKVQGVAKDENNALVRLADAIAGFVMDALTQRDNATQDLFKRMSGNGVLKQA